jgi:hypothetical protein
MLCNACGVRQSARLSSIIAGALIVWSAFPLIASAQVTVIESDGDKKPTIYRMTVSPAAEPKPALKYHFLVPPVDQIHDNAATLYYYALGFEGPDLIDKLDEVLAKDDDELFFSGPLDKFPAKDAENLTQWLQPESSYFLVLQRAARCDYARWEETIREQGIWAMLPHIQKSRGLANALQIRARLQIQRGQLNDAIETLRLGYALSRHLGKATTLVQMLVGIAIDGALAEQVRTLIAADDSPNLYWALTDLASDRIQLRQGMSYESQVWEFTVHELADIDKRIFSADEAFQMAKKVAEAGGSMTRGGRGQPAIDQAELLGAAVVLYPRARRNLLAAGYDEKRIDAMPIAQVVLLSWWREFVEIRDNAFKWILLPDAELVQHLQDIYQGTFAAERKGEGGIFTAALPAVQATIHARFRNQRYCDQLRIVEALRMYAAEHGRWPNKLDDVTAVSIPVDPATGKPFRYSVASGVAMLEPPEIGALPGGPAVDIRYELTLRKPVAK